MELRVAFGINSPLINKSITFLGWSDYLAVSSSKNLVTQSNKYIDKASNIKDIISSQIGDKTSKLTIIYSGPFSRFHKIETSLALRSLYDLYETLESINLNFPKLQINLSVIGSVEICMVPISDHYRSLKKIEFELFCVLATRKINYLSMSYFAVPTMRPNRLVGQIIKVDYNTVAKRFTDSLNIGHSGVGVYLDSRYLIFNMVIKFMINKNLQLFKW